MLSLYFEITTLYFVFNCFAEDLFTLTSNKFRKVCDVDGDPQLDSRDWSMHSDILEDVHANCLYCIFRERFCAHFPLIPQPNAVFNERPDFITVLLHYSLTRLQLLGIILNFIGISNRPLHAQVVNEVLNLKLITLASWSIFKVVCYFHAISDHWFNLSEAI